MDLFHWHQPHHRDLEEKEVELLRESVKLQREDLAVDRQIRDLLKPRLSSLKLAFTEKQTMPPVVGPAVINVGDKIFASVVGFDQNGQVFTGPVPTPTLSVDDSSIVSLDPATGLVTGLSAGVANVTAEVTSAEGADLTDTESVTVAEVPPPIPVLSSVKVAFSTDAPASPAVRR